MHERDNISSLIIMLIRSGVFICAPTAFWQLTASGAKSEIVPHYQTKSEGRILEPLFFITNMDDPFFFSCLFTVMFVHNAATCVTKLSGSSEHIWLNAFCAAVVPGLVHTPSRLAEHCGSVAEVCDVWACSVHTWSSTWLCSPQVESTASHHRSRDSWLRRLISSFCFSSKQPSSSVLCTSVELSKFTVWILMDHLPQRPSTVF